MASSSRTLLSVNGGNLNFERRREVWSRPPIFEDAEATAALQLLFDKGYRPEHVEDAFEELLWHK